MKHLMVRAGLLLTLLALVAVARAVQEPPRAPLPNFDQRDEAALKRPPAPAEGPAQTAAAARLQARVPGVKVERDARLATPKTISSTTGFLTGPAGEGRGVSAEAARAVPANDPHRAIKAFLNDHAALFGHGAGALDTARVKREFTTAHNGLRTTAWEQHLDGISVFEAILAAHVTKRGELVSVASQFLPALALAADRGHGNRVALQKNPTVSSRQALALAVKNVGEDQAAAAVTEVDAPPAGAEKRQRLRAGSIRHEAEARLVWLPMNRATLRLCWEVIFTSKARGEMFRVLLDAETGAVLVRQGLTSYISDATYRVYPGDSPSPFSPGHAVPSTNQPPVVPRVLVVTNAFNTNASPNGWIDDGVNETRGNNVDAHTDRDANDSPDLPRPQGSPARVFDFPMDLAQPPGTYGNAAVVQLFYLCNLIHDRFYELGFTEAAGNFQVNNFGRGGADNDPVQADAQDGDGFNNANFSTPPDGSSGRMQMFIFNGPTPDIDGDFDAEIVIHEYTHGLSNRRVGNGVGISALASAGMGEGWSDFYGLCLLSEEGDDVDGNYAAGGYATFEFFGLRENYYYGIRRYPYTTDLTKNPLTFKDIDPSQFSTHPGVPISPVGGFGFAAEVHNQGEVWCIALWEARANLIRKHGFAAGNQLMLRLVTDGMGLGPANPNFVQARDAILQADLVLTGGANQLELWQGFARRGLGAYATAPASSTTTGVRESFDLPDDLGITPQDDVTATGPAGGPFSVTEWVFTLVNTGSGNLPFTLTTRGLLEAAPLTGVLLPGGPAITVTARLSTATVILPAGIYSDALVFSNNASGVTQTRRLTLGIGQSESFTELFEEGGNDLDSELVTFTPDGSESFYSACRTDASVFPTDPAGGTEVSLSDDSFTSVTLDAGAEVSVYGRRTNVIFIGSNGYLTLDQGDPTFTVSFANHFRLPRVAALYRDLDPGSGGTVSWRQLADRVAVTWLNVPQFGATDANSFQIELFFDGRIRVTHLGIDAETGLAGLSAGAGIPAGFVESDWTAFPPCLPSLRVSVPSPVAENAGVLPDAGRVTLPMALGIDLEVNLSSTDASAVTVPAMVTIPAGQTSATFTVSILDDVLVDGTARARITATAADHRSGSALVTVQDNESATLGLTLPTSAREGDGLLVGAGTLTVTPAPDRALVVQLAASDTNELAVANGLVFVPAGQTSTIFDLRIMDDQRVDGTQTASLTAFVEGWPGQAVGTMHVLDNESTNLALNLPDSLSEGNGTLVEAGLVRFSGNVLSNVIVSLVSLDPDRLIVPATVTALAGQTFVRFDVTVVDNTAIEGPQSATVTASAPGFLEASDTTSIADNEIPAAPFFPQPRHLAENVTANADLSWSSGEGEQISNGGFETGAFTGWVQESTGPGGFVINSGTFDPESPDGPVPPRAGGFSALARQQGPGRHTIYQDVFIPSGATFAVLRWFDRIRNHAPEFGPGQNFRVEIRDPFDPLGTPLETVFFTPPGHPLLSEWDDRAVDLDAFRGLNIRVAFVVQDELGYLNVHLDDVSVEAGSPAPTVFDVYFGTTPGLGAAALLGTTTNTAWNLPPLAQLTTYYWQVVARRGPAEVPGPVWSFTTRGSTAPQTLVRTASTWKYRDHGIDLGTAWSEPDFDDSAWAQGPARLGYGGDGEATIVSFGPNSGDKYVTTYFRHRFVVTNTANYVALLGRLSRDDGAAVYLNGLEVIRDNLPFDFLDFFTYASTTVNSPNETAFFPFVLDPLLLVEGTNVLAAEVHQVTPNSSDLGFDFELVGTVLTATNQLPVVTVTAPASYALFSTPGNVSIAASASDPDGVIRRVEFFANDVKLSDDFFAPFTAVWVNPPAGTHAITAVATDSGGATNVSAPRPIVVNRSGGLPYTLVSFPSVWRYLDDGSDPGTAWRGTNFNDSGWLEGPAELGYGDGDEATVVGYGPDPNNRFLTTYFRQSFTNDAVFSSLTLNLIRDDGAVVYLNDVEVFRSNMPGGIIDYLTPAAGTVNAPQESQVYPATVSPALVRRGLNVIAVEIHQRDVFSSDISFQLELAGVGNLPPVVTLTAPAPDAVLTAPSGVPLAATASDRYGSIARVDFFLGTTALGSDPSAPYSLNWQPAPGVHTLTALATDNHGATNRSEAVTVTILPPPTLTATRAGEVILLSWPATAGEFVLESTASLAPPRLWTPVNHPVITVGDQLRTTVMAGPGHQFFRLVRP